MRLNNINPTNNIMTVVTKVQSIMRRMSTTKMIMMDVFKSMETDDIRQYMEVLTTNSNNLSVRFNNLSKVLFRQDYNNINSMRTLLTVAEQLLGHVTETMIVYNYCDNSGNVSWSNMVKDLTEELTRGEPPSAGLGM